ncbi:MAG: hypothetical protein HYU36_09470 [Planctomycetes bacterium]|nr:hypothetical protein [Planctomycetota bacterium]
MFLVSLFLLWIFSTPAEPDGLRLDYFPTLLHLDDAAHVHLSLIPPLRPGESLRLDALSRDGIVQWYDLPEADEQSIVRLTLRPKECRGIDAFRLARQESNRVASSFTFRLVRPAQGLPALEARGDGLWDEQGTRCLLLAEHRVRQVDKTWLPVRLFRKLMREEKVLPGVQILSDLDIALEGLARARFVIVQPGSSPSRPILEAIARASRVQELPSGECVVLFLGSRDVSCGTDGRDFRLGLEAILQHLQSRGGSHFRLAYPVSAPPYAERLEGYRERVREVAHVYFIDRAIDPDRFLPQDAWAAQSGSPILARWPDPKALEGVGRALAVEGLRSP